MRRAATQPGKRASAARKQPDDSERPRFTLGRRALTLGIASTTVVTVPVAKSMLPGHPLTALLLGLIPLVPYLLNVVVFALLFTVIMIVSLIGMIVYVASGYGEPIKCMNAMLTWCTNAPIAMVTLTPLPEAPVRSAELAKPARKRRAASKAALPAAAPDASRKQDTPQYWGTFQSMATQPGGAPDVVPPSAAEATPKVGRHARREVEEVVNAKAR